MVVKLNMILITSPELAEFRKRLKNIETKVRLLRYRPVPVRDADDLRRAGRPNAFHLDIQVLVPQRRGGIRSMPLVASLRACFQLAPDFVSSL